MEIKIIFVVILMTCTMSFQVTPGISSLVQRPAAERSDSIGTTPTRQDLIAQSENEQDAAESKHQKAPAKSEQAPGSRVDAAQSSGKNSDDAKTKPLKPFVPSEEIPADQAVDFPVDI